MKVEAVKRFMAKRPFKKLIIRMTSEQEHQVTHPEQIAIFPHHNTAVFWTEAALHFLDLDLIEEIASDGAA